jgi:hypothetical protein
MELPERQVPADPGWRAHVTLSEAGAAALTAAEGGSNLSKRPSTGDRVRVLHALPREARHDAATSTEIAQQQPTIVTELTQVIRRHVVCTQETETALAHAVLDVVTARSGTPEVGTVRRDERGQLWVGEHLWDDDGDVAARKIDLAERLAVDTYLDAHPQR